MPKPKPKPNPDPDPDPDHLVVARCGPCGPCRPPAPISSVKPALVGGVDVLVALLDDEGAGRPTPRAPCPSPLADRRARLCRREDAGGLEGRGCRRRCRLCRPIHMTRSTSRVLLNRLHDRVGLTSEARTLSSLKESHLVGSSCGVCSSRASRGGIYIVCKPAL